VLLRAQFVFAALLKRRMPCGNDSWLTSVRPAVSLGDFAKALEIEAVAENHLGN
jgi:hypothetical protein